MASNYTSNYSLCQWAADDKVLRTEFNADNAKIDAALGSLAASVSGAASGSEVSSLKTTVSGKADKSVVDSLSATVSRHTAELSKKGNCQLYTTSYTGTGYYGEGSPVSLTFPKKPIAVFVCSGAVRLSMFQGVGSARTEQSSNTAYATVSWSGNTVRWYSTSTAGQLNSTGAAYQVFAFLQAD